MDASVLAAKSDLYPKLWNSITKNLDDYVSIKLSKIARDFIAEFDYPLTIRDIILTGSIANYNWNAFSDIDLHIIIDFNDIPDEYLSAFKDYFTTKKNLWNKNHIINIAGHEVEIYIQDLHEPHHSTGVYSISTRKWLTEPRHKDHDIDYETITKKTDEVTDNITAIYDLLATKDYDKVIFKAEALQNKIKKYRSAGLQDAGEYSTENLVFKMLRNTGQLQSLSTLKRQAYDNKMSIDEEIFKYQSMIEEVKMYLNRNIK